MHLAQLAYVRIHQRLQSNRVTSLSPNQVLDADKCYLNHAYIVAHVLFSLYQRMKENFSRLAAISSK